MAKANPTVSPFAGKYKIPVHPESMVYLQEREAFGAKPSSAIPIEETRKNAVDLTKRMEALHAPYQYKGSSDNMVIPSPYSKGEITANFDSNFLSTSGKGNLDTFIELNCGFRINRVSQMILSVWTTWQCSNIRQCSNI